MALRLARQIQRATAPLRAFSTAVETPAQSTVKHPVSASKSDDYFAIVKLSGTQYKVAEGDVVVTEKLPKAEVGQTLAIDEVLLLGNVNETIIGRPIVDGAKVMARVEEQTVDEKIDIFKKKRRKNYRRWNGFRRQVTILRILGIEK